MQQLLSLFLSQQTLGQRMAAVNNRPSGFDYMRVVLALLIITVHSGEISYGPRPADEIYASLWRGPATAVVSMFFASSGFLVAGSLERSRLLVTFLGLRILRIVPALTGEVILSALLLGPLLTIYPLHNYFTDPRFFQYFQNIICNIHYQLPGLFVGNPDTDATNAQLWTLPYELMCYIIFAFLLVLGIYKRRWGLLAFTLLVCAFFLGGTDLEKHARPWTVTGNTLIMTALTGVLVFRFRNSIPWNLGLFAVMTAISLILLSRREWDAFTPFPLTYSTVYLGLLNPPRHKYILSGDYSYGLYLYGWPLQQTVAYFGPAFRHWYINLLLVYPSVVACAFVSWWVIEKPVLSLSRHLKRFDEKKK